MKLTGSMTADDIEKAFGKAEGDTDVELSGRPTSIKTLEWERIHQTLADADFNISEAARRLGIPYLSLFAFSTENWQRPRREVDSLMRLRDLSVDAATGI